MHELSSSTMSNTRFWVLSIGLLIVWAVVLTTAEQAAQMPALLNEKDPRNTKNCKTLCQHCGCMGFYCGEECLCECNKNPNANTECIANMQTHARKLKAPFEVLIQGPSSSQFVRKAHQFEHHHPKQVALPTNLKKKKSLESYRNKRSTIVIYKPSQQNSVQNGQCEVKAAQKPKEVAREKRAVNQLEWFSDLANTLVRPAPLNGQKRNGEAVKAVEALPQKKRSNSELDRSWFADNSNTLTKPAPLNKRQNAADTEEAPEQLLNIEKIPQVIKDTIRNIQEATALKEDAKNTFRMNFQDVGDLYQNRMQANKLYGKDLRYDFADTFSNMRDLFERKQSDANVPSFTPVPAVPQPKVMLPWFRPVRFLERVQEVIN